MWKKEGKAGGVSQALNEQVERYDTTRTEVELSRLRGVSQEFLEDSGFNEEEARMTTENLVEAEIAGKLSHGIIRLQDLRTLARKGDIRTGTSFLDLVREGPDSLYFDARYMSGSVALYRSLEKAFSFFDEHADRSLLMVGIKDMSYASGYIGDFARRAAERGLVFLSFFNSPPILIPWGSRDPQWGTDPVTFSFPSGPGADHVPVIHDSASSIITWGEMMNRHREGRPLPEGVALDEQGQATLSPREGMKGGLLTHGEHKGSGLALMVELMAGALTGSRVGTVVDGGWGGSYLLIRPGIFRSDVEALEHESDLLLEALTGSRPREGFEKVYFPGQQSQTRRREVLKSGRLMVPTLLWQKILAGLEEGPAPTPEK